MMEGMDKLPILVVVSIGGPEDVARPEVSGSP